MDSLPTPQWPWLCGRYLPPSPFPHSHAGHALRPSIHSFTARTQGQRGETQTHENEPSLRRSDHPAWKCSRRGVRIHVPKLQDGQRYRHGAKDRNKALQGKEIIFHPQKRRQKQEEQLKDPTVKFNSKILTTQVRVIIVLDSHRLETHQIPKSCLTPNPEYVLA